MKTRALTPRTNPTPESTRDWVFGHGLQDLLTGDSAIALSIETALQVFRGEAFWQTNFGVDWWNLLGAYGAERVKETIITQAREVILSIEGINAITSIEATMSGRKLTLTYKVSTDNSIITNFTTLNI